MRMNLKDVPIWIVITRVIYQDVKILLILLSGF
jgi:hypothetical protein